MKVYQAIGAVSEAMSREGIAKAHKNAQQGYQFRGIDDVLNALSKALIEAGLVILPRCVERTVVERQTKTGGALFFVTCRVEFDLVCIEDGSKHTIATYGEAMDSADKATNKAMSAAYKYLALLTFCIPTEATTDTDADFETPEVRAQKRVEWINEWLAAIDGAATVGDLKKTADAGIAAAKEQQDVNAEAQFVAARDAKLAKAKTAASAKKAAT